MWARSAKSKETGLFTVECFAFDGELFFRGEFGDGQEANRAGEDAERRMMVWQMTPTSSAVDD